MVQILKIFDTLLKLLKKEITNLENLFKIFIYKVSGSLLLIQFNTSGSVTKVYNNFSNSPFSLIRYFEKFHLLLSNLVIHFRF
jgi:hypothetical protein